MDKKLDRNKAINKISLQMSSKSKSVGTDPRIEALLTTPELEGQHAEIESMVRSLMVREQLYAACDKLLAAFAEKLISLVPPELEKFKESELLCRSPQKIEQIAYWTQMGHPLSEKVDDLDNCGFESEDDAVEKLQLLKKAWENYIDITVIPPGGVGGDECYVVMQWRLPTGVNVAGILSPRAREIKMGQEAEDKGAGAGEEVEEGGGILRN